MVRRITKTLMQPTVIRFAAVGVINTLTDFLLFNLLLLAMASNPPSRAEILIFNSISATTVAIFSFILNRRFVFKSQDTPHHYVVYFILITLVGLYVIQNALIYLTTHLFHSWAGPLLLANVGKLLATGGSMLWNFVMYKRIVFRSKRP